MRGKLDYIYYRLYRFQISVGNYDIAVFSSVLFLCFLILINFYSVLILLGVFAGIKLPIKNLNLTIVGLSIFLGILLILYFLFIFKKRYKQIIKKYQNEDKSAVKKGNISVTIFFIITILVIWLAFYFVWLDNTGHLR